MYITKTICSKIAIILKNFCSFILLSSTAHLAIKEDKNLKKLILKNHLDIYPVYIDISPI